MKLGAFLPTFRDEPNNDIVNIKKNNIILIFLLNHRIKSKYHHILIVLNFMNEIP
tara:strand:- start:695 stop:859 length:165 start_codon:yes stop_codon:yes gene_type:complete